LRLYGAFAAGFTDQSGARTAHHFWDREADFVPRYLAIFRISRPGTFVSGTDWFSIIGEEVAVMLSWVVTFLIIALIAGVLGFGGLAGASIEIAKTIFFIAVILFLVSAVVGLARGRTSV
jgi:uncharacterized membrane protein YtjA (UPF0391 family)